MGLVELFVIAVGLSMDAFAVSICKGLATKKVELKHMAIAGLWFGGFQALMPLIGYFLGIRFKDVITDFDHWIAFGLLAIIGGNMIRESFSNEEDDEDQSSYGVKEMFLFAVATSIDALAVGVSFGFLDVQIVPAVSFIGCITFVFSAIGIKLGHFVGSKFEKRAELFGGVVLVLIGVKILLEHLGVL